MSLQLTDWNAVAQVDEAHFGPAKFNLLKMGTVGETDWRDTLVLRVDDLDALLDRLERRFQADTGLFEVIRYVRPIHRHFQFDTPADFKSSVLDAALGFRSRLIGRHFDIRTSLRGSTEEFDPEEFRLRLGDVLQETLQGATTRPTPSDRLPEMLLDLETVGQTGGLACWSRPQLKRYPFLRFD